MKKQDLQGLLTLLSVPGVGPVRARALVDRFGTPEAVWRAGESELRKVRGIDERTASAIRTEKPGDFAEKQIDEADKHQVAILTLWDPEYPERLKAIDDPPPVLFVRGQIRLEDKNAVAVVGTRFPSTYGRGVAEGFAQDLARRRITVVSGMARGIDTCAHQGALRAGGRTIAVLGSGVDVIYPPENRKLSSEIAGHGAVISEFFMNTEPSPVHFPRRNRIISGLCSGTVVVEAGIKSGALITAYSALDQNRDVFAVPGSIRSPKSRGTHGLIQEGAKLVTCVEDILDEVQPVGMEKEIDKEPRDMTAPEKTLWSILSEDPMPVDEIASKAGLKSSETLAVLLSLELKDGALQYPGMRFARKA